MQNFKEETMELIDGLKVREYRLIRNNYGTAFKKNIVLSGEDEINWNKLPNEDILFYDNGYGIAYWDGWITFKDTSDWLERKEYDGSEWWEWQRKPSLGD